MLPLVFHQFHELLETILRHKQRSWETRHDRGLAHIVDICFIIKALWIPRMVILRTPRSPGWANRPRRNRKYHFIRFFSIKIKNGAFFPLVARIWKDSWISGSDRSNWLIILKLSRFPAHKMALKGHFPKKYRLKGKFSMKLNPIYFIIK